MDNLANILSNMLNAERTGKRTAQLKPYSKIIAGVMDIMQKNNYISSYEIIKDNKGDIVRVTLSGKINKCGVITPRFSVKKDGYKKYEKRYLPAKGFGFLIVSTPKGLMTHVEAQELGIGGKLVSYCY